MPGHAVDVIIEPVLRRDRHTQTVLDRTVLRDVEGSGDCEWLDRHGDGTTSCRVNDAKPDQCISFPFWPRILRSRRTWETAGVHCRGVGKGEVVSAEEIRRRAGPGRADADLETLLEELDAEVREMGATCWLSGNCCDFPAAGHRLFTSALEARRFVRGVDTSGWDPESGLCPAWKDRKCTARDLRPVACRVYYCDPEFEERVQDLMERYVTRLKWLHEKHGLEWDYRDFLEHLRVQRADRAATP